MAVKSNFLSVISAFLVALVRQALNCEDGTCKMKSVLLPCGLILLGCGSAQPSNPAATPTARVTCVWGGTREAIALKSDGTVWTWGENYWGGAYKGYGKLGNGTRADQLLPARVPGLTHVVQASGGDDFSAVLKSDGTVWTFGANGAGQLGNGDPLLAEQLSPVQVVGLKDVIYITARDFHAQAIRSDGTVWSWGSGVQGELGVGGKPLSVQQQFELTGAADHNATPPYCTNSNVPLQVQWP
jgi:alpha-tubulin suppressor-like RCC1 family protein